MGVNKKGIFFTLTIIFLLLVILFFFSVHQYNRQSKDTLVSERRIIAMDNFIENVERDIERGMYISGFRGILAMQEYISETGQFVDGFEASLKEAILNGTVQGYSTDMMTSSRYQDWVDRISLQASRQKMIMNAELTQISVFQDDPWHVNIAADIVFSFVDTSNLASFHFNDTITARISIEGFEDPFYIVYLEGRMTNLFRKTPFTSFGNASNLLNHTYEGYYIANDDAPSFMMRFEEEKSPSPYGIESLLDKKEMDNLDLSPDTYKSVVDHVYWSDDDPETFRINNTPSWFNLDADHLSIYNTEAIR